MFKHTDGKEYSLADYIKLLKEEGNSTAEISALVGKQDDNDDIKETIETVKKELKAIEIQKTVEADEAKSAKDDEFSKAVKEAVKEEMKGLEPVREEVKEIKRFNVLTGKHEDYKKMSESKKAIADCLYHSLNNDMASVKAVQKDVDAEIQKEYKQLGIKTALYSNTGSGAYTVPTEVNDEIAVSRYNQSEMYQRANKQAILYNDKVYPVCADMTFATRTNENTAWADKTPVLENPTIETTEYGGLALMSRRLVEIRSPEIVDMLVAAAGSADAKFIDTTAAFSVTTDADDFNGIIFDSLTGGVTSKALTAISEDDFINLINGLSDNVDDITFIANRKVRMKYGNLDTENGGKVFRDFMSNGQIAPMGYDFIENRKIPSTLTINASSGNTNTRAGGNSDCLVCADLSKLYIATGLMRIDYSEHYKFAEDQVAWKFVNRIGTDVVTDSGNVAATVIELTNS